MMKSFITIFVCILSVLYAKSETVLGTIERIYLKHVESKNYLPDDPAVAFFYGAIKILEEFKADITEQKTYREKIHNQLEQLLQQQREYAIPWYVHMSNYVYQYIVYAQNVINSPKRVCISIGISIWLLYLVNLIRVQIHCYTAYDEKEKAYYMRVYKLLVKYINMGVAAEKVVTNRIRDAFIGLLGKGKNVTRIVSSIFDVLSFRSLFYIDDKLLVL